MKRMSFVVAVLAIAPLLMFSTGGCGSGDSMPSGPNARLLGSYCFIAFSGTDGATDEANATWGDVTADGLGMITGGTRNENENGVVTTDAYPATPYSIDAAGVMTLFEGAVAAFRGAISADGNVACLSAIANGESPAIIILGKKEGTYSNASLNGLYHLAGIAYVFGGPSDNSTWGTTMFDGAGMHMESQNENTDGTVAGPFNSNRTYSVAADGSVTADFGGVMYSGAILAGGELIILAGDTTAAGPPYILILTKGTSGATNALLSGTYTGVGFQADDSPPPEWSSYLFTPTADGTGASLAFPDGIQNDDGTVMMIGADGSNYTVSPTGLFNWFGISYTGGVAPSGNYAVCAGISSGGGGVMQLFFFLK